MNETKTAEAPLRADLAGAAVGGLVTWLQMIAERRDFTLPMPAGSWLGSAIEVLLEMLSGEFRAYGSVAAGAREAARRNEENLQSVVRTADEQESTARTTAGAAAEAGAGAARMSDAVDALCDLVDKAVRAAGDARSNLDLIAAALSGLAERLAQGDAPIVAMQRSTSGVAEFLGTLARLSRHAQLLAVNASIEAAHLGDAGARFAIVADQVRRLSTSTHESKIDVAQIVGELRQSSRLIAAAVGESTAATQGAGGEIASSTKALAQTGASISEFATTVDSVAEASATQGTALPAISAAMGELARHAEEAAASSRRASELAIDDLLVRAQTTAGRWTLRGAAGTDRSAAIGADSEFGAWIASLSAGTDPAAPADIDRDAVLRPVVDAVRSLVERVNTEQRDVLADVVAVAVAVSRNSYAWRSIAESLEGVVREVEIVRGTVRESAASAQISLASAAAMKTLVASIRSQHNDVLVLLEGALERIALIGRTVETIDTGVASMSAAASRADGIMALIEMLASETDLLSLNAAIEAAHAGDHGLGFSVIAEEIRALARSTNDSTTSVSQLVAHIAGSSGELQNTISRAAASTADVMSSADGARLAIAMLRESFESAERHALAVSEIAAEQAQRLDRVSDAVNRAAAALEQKTASSTDRGRLELAVLGARAHEIAARRPLGTVVERVRDLTESLCVRLEAAIEAAIAARGFSRERLFALSYREITGSEIGSLARLFDVSLVPESGFTPAKYATPWDAAIDEAMIEVLTAGWDEALAAQISPVAIFVSDLNGLFYAYPRQKIAVWTNDPAKDLLGNRIKRLFEDEYALRVGRLGLGPNADRFGPRTPYESFRDAGCTLRRTPERPWGGYVYARDTSLVCNEVVMALYAGDLRHSTLRVCYDPSLI